MLGMIRKLAALRAKRLRRGRGRGPWLLGLAWGVWFGLFLAAVFAVLLGIYALRLAG